MSRAARVVSFIGMPGGGKSTVGTLLARRLGIPFADTDALIEERTGCAVADLFVRDGEPAFRTLESTLLAELTEAGAPIVIATGGGSVLAENNRALLRDRTMPIYLHAFPDDLWRRVRGNSKRPLLRVSDPLARLRELYAERHPLYESVARLTVRTGRPPLRNVVDEIVALMESAENALPRTAAGDPEAGKPAVA